MSQLLLCLSFLSHLQSGGPQHIWNYSYVGVQGEIPGETPYKHTRVHTSCLICSCSLLMVSPALVSSSSFLLSCCCSLLMVSSALVSSASFLLSCCCNSLTSCTTDWTSETVVMTTIHSTTPTQSSPGSWVGCEVLVSIPVCSFPSHHLSLPLWPPLTDPVPHQCLVGPQESPDTSLSSGGEGGPHVTDCRSSA